METLAIDTMTADVVVIGAGCAGLSAAVRLALAGRRVVVIEESPRLGGRATSFITTTDALDAASRITAAMS